MKTFNYKIKLSDVNKGVDMSNEMEDLLKIYKETYEKKTEEVETLLTYCMSYLRQIVEAYDAKIDVGHKLNVLTEKLGRCEDCE